MVKQLSVDSENFDIQGTVRFLRRHQLLSEFSFQIFISIIDLFHFFFTNFPELLSKVGDLKRMYDLFSRVPSTLDCLRDCMCDYVRKAGRELVTDQVCGWGVYSYDFLLLPSTSYCS